MNTNTPPSAAGAAGADCLPPALPRPARGLIRRPLLVWSGFALLLAALPLGLTSGLALALMMQMGIAIITCLSFNVLFGQGGLLSFGHAVFTGLGAYAVIHALLACAPAPAWLIALMPLAGALAGALAASVLGYVATRALGRADRSGGIAFAMMTLGLGELVYALAQMLPGVFGGDAGIAADRMARAPWLGMTWGPARQLYGLVAVYTLISVAALYAFAQTPLGRILTAVRDNAERAAFIGYDSRRVRYLAFIVAGFFAGLAGGLAALQLEMVTPQALSTQRSGTILLFTFMGGAGAFGGPILGGVLMVLATVWLSTLTSAWTLYTGLLFMLLAMFAPDGLMGLLARLCKRVRHV